MNNPFFCQACLVDKEHSEMSHIDSRYCQGCYDFLLKEAERLSDGRRPAWIPVPSADAVSPKLESEKQWGILGDGAKIMSTLISDKSKVDTMQAQDSKLIHEKRGPKHRKLPKEFIIQLHGERLGSNAIATLLRTDRGTTVSYKTVQRILSGESNNQGE
jgi:hypothetical protein